MSEVDLSKYLQNCDENFISHLFRIQPSLKKVNIEGKDLELKSKQKSKLSDLKSDIQETESLASSMSSPVMSKATQFIKDPLLASVHDSSVIRFWDLSGELLLELQSVIPKPKIPVTAVCFNSYTQHLYTGNAKGYVSVWDVKTFIQDPKNQEPQSVKQTLYWRAHLNKIINLVIVEASNLILSTSVDGSIRVWLATNGFFIGFFGQTKPMHIPNLEKLQKNAILPFDINEGPMAAVEKTKSTPKIKIRHKFEYPLIFAPSRWEPFHRSAYNARKSENPASASIVSEEEKKFFGALMKPKAYNSHLESYITADHKSGAVFRSLPVYSVPDPDFMKKITATFSQFQNNMTSLGTNQIMTKTNKRKTKDGGNSFLSKLSSL